MDYESLTDEEKRQIIANRLKQYEQEHFNHTLNLETIKKSELEPEPKKMQAAQAKDAMAQLEHAITMHRNKLKELDRQAKKNQ